MAIFNCKQCGAKLNLLGGEYILTCDYCGTKQTVQGNEVFELDRNFKVSDSERERLDSWVITTELMESMLLRSEFNNAINEFNKTTYKYGYQAPWKTVFCMVMATLNIRKPEDFETYEYYKSLCANEYWKKLKTSFAYVSDNDKAKADAKKYILAIEEKVCINEKNRAISDIQALLDKGTNYTLFQASDLVHSIEYRSDDTIALMEQIDSTIYDLGKREFDRGNHKDAVKFFGKCLKYKDALNYYEISTDKLNGSDIWEFEESNKELDAQILQLQKDLNCLGVFDLSKKKAIKESIKDCQIKKETNRLKMLKIEAKALFTYIDVTIENDLKEQNKSILTSEDELLATPKTQFRRRSELKGFISDKKKFVNELSKMKEKNASAFEKFFKGIESQMNNPAVEHKQLNHPAFVHSDICSRYRDRVGFDTLKHWYEPNNK